MNLNNYVIVSVMVLWYGNTILLNNLGLFFSVRCLYMDLLSSSKGLNKIGIKWSSGGGGGEFFSLMV